MKLPRAVGVAPTLLALGVLGLIAAAFEQGLASVRDPHTPSQPSSTALSPSHGLELNCPLFLQDWRTLLALIGIVSLTLLAISIWRGSSPLIAGIVSVPLLIAGLSVCPVGVRVPSWLPVSNGPNLGIGTNALFITLSVWGVITILSGIAILYRLRGSTSSLSAATDSFESVETDLTEIADVAGASADRIADSDPSDNEVYRSWKQFTDLLALPDPETCTPDDFADAAIAAGMDPEHVTQLTDFFRAVRYGGHPATDHEEPAIELFREIEKTYRATSESNPSQEEDNQ